MNGIALLSPYFFLMTLMLVGLSINVVLLRRKFGVPIYGAQHKQLDYAIRAQGNFIEYTPFAFILFILLILNDCIPWIVHLLALAFVCGRLLHAYGLLVLEQREIPSYQGRIFGMGINFSVFLIGGLTLLVLAFL